MIIGITGQIGSGKSTAAEILRFLGAVVIDADRIGREVVNDNPALLRSLVKQFGRGILGRTGRLNRKKLAELAFENEKSRQTLNRLVHPYLLKELKQQVRAVRSRHRLIVIDAALLLEWDLNHILDTIVLIHASESTRLARLEKRGITRRDALARQRRQLSYRQQCKRANHVILNNKTVSDLKAKLKRLLSGLQRKTVDL
ncbi:MAG: dephospho-CoA kinase [Candidatus Zixiibacteriota bacterium]|nr:MAG: dephospho-CoA kinase [candidate division Zixibacteria bacterium]